MNLGIPLEQLPEAKLREEADRLEQIVQSEEATVAQADRLMKLRRALQRINAVRTGKAWEMRITEIYALSFTGAALVVWGWLLVKGLL